MLGMPLNDKQKATVDSKEIGFKNMGVHSIRISMLIAIHMRMRIDHMIPMLILPP